VTILIAGTINVDPAKAEAALADAVEMMKATHEEEGNLAYVFSLDPLVPGQIQLFEKWADEESLAAHSASAHMAEFRPKMGGWGVTGADIKKYEIASEGPLR
jgi:quinol monooxygenase YgiN